MDSQIAKKNQSLTTAEEMRNQTKLIMQSYANWEEYLAPAPLSIAILGELVFISSTLDFSFNKNPPKEAYQYIKYPDSFRACLMQVCNSGWWAFNEAHKNMDQIRLHTLTVPDYMKTVVKILFQGNDEVVQAHLPDQLENIRVIADNCLALANATEKRFTDVINIIQELLEACVKAEHFYGEEKEAMKNKIEEEKLREASSKKAVKHSERAVKALEEELKEAHESYNKAMNSLPSGWKMMAEDLCGAIIDKFSFVVLGLTAVITKPGNLCSTLITVAGTVSHLRGKESAADCIDGIIIYSKSAEILMCTNMIQRCVQENMIDWNSLYDQKHKATITDFIAEQLKGIKRSLENIQDCKAKDQAQKLCDDGIKICDDLAKYAPDRKCKEVETLRLIKEISELNKSAYVFDTKSKNVMMIPALTPKLPTMFVEERKTKRFKTSDNSRFHIEQSRAQLNKTRESYENSLDTMEKNQKELTEILVTMRNCESKKVDFNTTIKMLVKGMDAMGRVKEQWEKMVRFFQMVSNIVGTSLTRTLKDFATTSEKTQSLSYDAKLFYKKMIYNQAFQATNITSLVHMISSTYTDVSSKHLMDRVSSLGKLMAMDKEKPEFEHERVKLQNSCDEAQKAISELVIKNKKEFERKTDARLETIDKEFKAILPSASPQEVTSIQAAIKSEFTDEDE